MRLLLPLLLQRYRALFALRNKGGEEAVQVLGEAFRTDSALLKHEVAYVMGQMQHPASAGVLGQVLQVSWCIYGKQQPQQQLCLTIKPSHVAVVDDGTCFTECD